MKKIKATRALSFLAVGIIYILAATLGIAVYILSAPMHFALRLLLADFCATVFVFIFSLIFKNASVYDPYWSVQPPVILTAFAVFYGVNTLGIFLLIAVWFWAIRLTANWAYTFRGLNYQDWRYKMLNEKTGAFYPIINFVGIHLVPTLVVYSCILPAVSAIVYRLEPNPISVIFSLLSISAAVMQCAADMQMHAFRKRKTGGFIDTGLWKYSRHPNYLGEILVWWCIGLAVFASFPRATHPLLLGAFLNTLLFLFVSIPMADGRQAQKAGFPEYKKSTRMLLPIYKKQ